MSKSVLDTLYSVIKCLTDSLSVLFEVECGVLRLLSHGDWVDGRLPRTLLPLLLETGSIPQSSCEIGGNDG